MTAGVLGVTASWELRPFFDGRADLLISPSLDLGLRLRLRLTRDEAMLIARSIVGELANGEAVITQEGACVIAAHGTLGSWQVLADGFGDATRPSTSLGGITPAQGVALYNALRRYAATGLVGADG